MTYYEKWKHHAMIDGPFDWNTVLDKAICEGLDDEEADTAQVLSAVWITCACGKQDESIPRFKDGRPVDPELAFLGCQFHDEIAGEDYLEAKHTLQAIEERAAIVLKLIEEQQ